MMKKFYQRLKIEIVGLDYDVMGASTPKYLSHYDNTLEDPFV